MMQFDKVEGASALVRGAGGVLKIFDLFTRNQRLYIKHNGGFLEIGPNSGGDHLTSTPCIRILEIDCPGVSSDKLGRPTLLENSHG